MGNFVPGPWQAWAPFVAIGFTLLIANLLGVFTLGAGGCLAGELVVYAVILAFFAAAVGLATHPTVLVALLGVAGILAIVGLLAKSSGLC